MSKNELSFIKLISGSSEETKDWFSRLKTFIENNKLKDHSVSNNTIDIKLNTGIDVLEDERYIKGDLYGEIPSKVDSTAYLNIIIDKNGDISADCEYLGSITMRPGKSYPDYYSKSMGQWYPGESDDDEYSNSDMTSEELDLDYNNLFEWIEKETELKITKDNIDIDSLHKALDEFLEYYIESIKDLIEVNVDVVDYESDYDDEPDDDY